MKVLGLMMATVAEQLGDAVRGRVVTDPFVMTSFRQDQCSILVGGSPAAVVEAESQEDVLATIRIANAVRTPVVVRGSGSGLAGGANAIDGCIVLSTARMNRILDVDRHARTATVEPGVINADLDSAARSEGLWYPPDPGSRAISSIGGNLATNAGGMCCVKYGVTADFAMALTAVTGGGELVRTGGTTRKNVAGLDLTRLLVGSEGSLAVIVEAQVRLCPLEAGEATVVASFASVEAAVESVVALSGRVVPRAAELLDAVTIGAVNAMTHIGLDDSAGALLLLQFDGPMAEDQAEFFAQVAAERGAFELYRTADPAEGTALMEARRVAYAALERLGSTILDDVGVAIACLPALVREIAAAASAHQVVVGTFGHVADGNLHPTIVFDATDSDSRERAHGAFVDIVRAALRLGGTISGEHGVGELKLPFLADQVGEVERALMRRVKAAFDPLGILGPGRAY